MKPLRYTRHLGIAMTTEQRDAWRTATDDACASSMADWIRRTLDKEARRLAMIRIAAERE